MSHSKPWVQVTLQGPEDGGDFGPLTPGTRTSGLQEAIDCAHAQGRDVYIWGGRGGLHRGEGLPGNIYALDEPLRIPWSRTSASTAATPFSPIAASADTPFTLTAR